MSNVDNDKLASLFRIEKLPSECHRDSWDRTYVDTGLKREVFDHVAMLPQLRHLPDYLRRGQRMMLLYGHPGVGKTTLALGLANQFAELGLRRDGADTILLEAQASVWFSEYLGRSAKIVSEAFEMIRLVARHRRTVLLINELESVATNRNNLTAGDPTDLHRFVNSFLNQLDQLDGEVDFLFLATSNQVEMIDPAFLDRTGNIFHISFPGRSAAGAILHDVARACNDIGLAISKQFVTQIIAALYLDPGRLPQLSGRNLCNLIPKTMCRMGTMRPSWRQVVTVARELISKETVNGTA